MPPQDQTPTPPAPDNANDAGSVINVSTPGDNAATGIDPLAAPAPTPSMGSEMPAGDSVPVSVNTPDSSQFAVADPAPATAPPDSFSAASEPLPEASAAPAAPTFGADPAPATDTPASSFDAAAAASTPGVAPAPVDPNAPTPSVAPLPGHEPHAAHKGGSKKGLVIAAVVGVVVIVLILVVVVVMGMSSKPADHTDMVEPGTDTTTIQ